VSAMTHRERILTALDHRTPDRLPMDIGSARVASMVGPVYEKLRSHLGFGRPGSLLDRMSQLVEMDPSILEYFDVDVRGFSNGRPDRGGDEELGPDRYRDEWGVVRARPPASHYYDMVGSPLAGDISAETIARYPWPDPTDPGTFRQLRAKATALRQTDYAVLYNARFFPVHMTQYLRGFEDWFLDIAANQELFATLMRAVTEVFEEMTRRALREVGDLIDIVCFADDVGQQDRTICSLATYRKLIRPYHERFVELVRTHSKAKILYHTCGSVYKYINDFIDMGIDAINPVQVRAKDMEPARLKREFGDRISFWGGIDTQKLLPHGSPAEVAAEVRRMFEVMGGNGGYVLASVHNLQPDVPPENVCAMFAEGKLCVYDQKE
jgi:uroporphyrinogen decarboxylase